MGLLDILGGLGGILVDEFRFHHIIEKWMQYYPNDYKLRETIRFDLALFIDMNDLKNMESALKKAMKEARDVAEKNGDSVEEALYRLRKIHRIFIEEVQEKYDTE